MEKINEITSQEERNKVTPECYLYLEENGKILLGCRKNTQFEDGKYNPVAGHVEKGEDALSAVIREAKEEANIILEKENVKLVYTMYKLFPGEEKISFFFKADSYSGTVTNMEPDKCSDLDWFPLDNLPDNTSDFVRQAIKKILNGVNYSVYTFS